ncbi:DUF2238 domain-containing protein [Methylotenera sp. L2L1]|uniref:DUF2238 domain-containing protein n=1 Tax=Methylotenera sp. L2L1 TaxID=1502770 RepID=UPI0005651F32|nr:DUF2238 domain-containing protein [Methylotenera sp. L2L1]
MVQVHRHFYLVLLSILGAVFAWSAINPADRLTWVLEVAPVVIVLPILVFTYRSFVFTPLVYVLILIHALILLVGGHYTYAEVPWFNWLRDTYELSRNYYDRVGHFAQGFVPAMVAREILLRKSPLVPGRWLLFIVSCICLSISAFYELIEWWVAAYEGGAADAFLGTQGDVWDTQWDMLIALVGAITAQVFLAKVHDRQMMNVSR